ncbi:MAG: hypothetical protein ACXWEQ_05920 [Halobacteriota archaeon]
MKHWRYLLCGLFYVLPLARGSNDVIVTVSYAFSAQLAVRPF